MSFKSTKIEKLLLLGLVLFVGYSYWKFKEGRFSKGDPIQEGLPEKFALLVIDYQNDFLDPKGKHPVPQEMAQSMTSNINKLVSWARSSQIHILYTKNEFAKSDWWSNLIRSGANIKGEWGSEFYPQLEVSGQIFTKDHQDSFTNEQFDQYIRDHKITGLIFTGVYADQCVQATLEAARARKLKVLTIEDAVGTATFDRLYTTLKNFKDKGIDLVKTEELINQNL